MLAKALAHYFEAKILLLDPTDFLIKVSFTGAFESLRISGYVVMQWCSLQLHGKYGTGGSEQVRR